MRRQNEFAFIALQFDEAELEDFVASQMKPFLVEVLGCPLEDMRNKSQAGVIDNLIRDAIRDAKFVVADLTHGNNGVYWEAGYAEALGKPVVYTCERERFKEIQTHFDTNHCTTVFWSSLDPQAFREEFANTVRRSLELM